MNIIQATIAADISFSAFETAVATIRAQPNEVVLYIPHDCVCVGYKIKERYACKVVETPNELTTSNFCWAVIWE